MAWRRKCCRISVSSRRLRALHKCTDLFLVMRCACLCWIIIYCFWLILLERRRDIKSEKQINSMMLWGLCVCGCHCFPSAVLRLSLHRQLQCRAHFEKIEYFTVNWLLSIDDVICLPTYAHHVVSVMCQWNGLGWVKFEMQFLDFYRFGGRWLCGTLNG